MSRRNGAEDEFGAVALCIELTPRRGQWLVVQLNAGLGGLIRSIVAQCVLAFLPWWQASDTDMCSGLDHGDVVPRAGSPQVFDDAGVAPVGLHGVSHGALGVTHSIKAVQDELRGAINVVVRERHGDVLGGLRRLGERSPHRRHDSGLDSSTRLSDDDGGSSTPKLLENVPRARSVAIKTASEAYQPLFVNLSRIADHHFTTATIFT